MTVDARHVLGPALGGTLARTSGVTVLHLTGDIDVSAEAALARLLSELTPPVRVDMTEVSFVDLRGVRVIVRAADRLDLVVVGGPATLDLVLGFLGDAAGALRRERPA